MNFGKRLRLYLTGVFLGIIVVWFMLIRGRDRNLDGWLPNERVLTDLQAQPFQYTAHARCRMQCRNITEAEIELILKTGEVNFSKSDPRDTPCKSYAIEGKGSGGRDLRVVFGACDSLTKVITAIDLNRESEKCLCD